MVWGTSWSCGLWTKSLSGKGDITKYNTLYLLANYLINYNTPTLVMEWPDLTFSKATQITKGFLQKLFMLQIVYIHGFEYMWLVP
jgi:hypothetical protein